MRFYLSTLYFLPLLLLLTGCQTVTEHKNALSADSKEMVFLPLAIPLQVDYQDEVNLLRINHLIAELKKPVAKEQARLFYERGLVYDRMGLNANSRYNFSQAISIDPTFAPAYSILGLNLLITGAYDEAFDDFDSALELSDKMQYSYLHRAVGLYQIQRYSLASKDIEAFYALDQTDPYRNLWRYIINSKVDQDKALSTLKSVQKTSEDNRFAWSLIDVIVGRKTEAQFFKILSYGRYTNKDLAQRLCEAYFYLGHWHKLHGDLNTAIHYFKLSAATNVHHFIEYKYALIELSSIQSLLKIKFKNLKLK